MLMLSEEHNFLQASLVLIIVLVASLVYYFRKQENHKDRNNLNLPPGSFGLPVIGETFSFMKAMREDRISEWIKSRALVNNAVFKTSIMGSSTVVITGRAGNKFVFSATDEVLSVNQPQSIVRLSGKHNIFELTGARYKLVKGGIMTFLKPERLQEYVSLMDTIVKTQLLTETTEKDEILAVPFMKKVTFNLTCTLLFGLHDEPTKERLFDDFIQVLKGLWSLPIIIPGTTYHRALQARARIEKRVIPILESRRKQLSEGRISGKDDLLSSFLSLRDENDEQLRDEEIIDNFVTIMVASHDTTAILLSLLVWKLARDPMIYNKVLEEQMEILRERQEAKQSQLIWSEVQKMKYTWRVAQELMRLISPVFGNFRKAAKDTRFEGYDIPKGWQVFWEVSGTHMDMDIFEDPEKFDPSRFENPSRPIPPFAYIPFGSGPRMCIGNEFARVEALVVMHNLVTNFEWVQQFPDEKIIRDPFPYPSKGLPIKLKARNRSEKLHDNLTGRRLPFGEDTIPRAADAEDREELAGLVQETSGEE